MPEFDDTPQQIDPFWAQPIGNDWTIDVPATTAVTTTAVGTQWAFVPDDEERRRILRERIIERDRIATQRLLNAFRTDGDFLGDPLPKKRGKDRSEKAFKLRI